MSQTEFPPVWSPSRDLADGETSMAPKRPRKALGKEKRADAGDVHLRIDLNASVSWEDARDAARRFLRWWLAQLGTFVPAKIRERLAVLSPRYRIAQDGAGWMLGAEGKTDAIALDPRMPDAELRERIARFEPRARNARIDMEIGSSDVLARKIRLAAAARGQLRAAVALQLERLSPFKADDEAFDCRTDAISSDGEIDVAVALVPRAVLDGLEKRLRAVGLDPNMFFTRDGWSFAARHRRVTQQETLQLALAGAAAATILAAVLLAPVLRDAELQSLSQELADMRGPARQAAILRDEWESLRNPMDAAAARVTSLNDLEILKLLTNRLPDDVVLSMLTIDGSTVLIEGTAPDAKRVAQLLGPTSAFSGVRLRGARRVPGGQSFDIVLTLAKAEAP